MTLADATMLLVLVLAGFTACAEFGSYAFVHPVIRRLPHEHHVAVERGLVRTFGRVMPVLMTASLLGIVAWASVDGFAAPAWQVGAIATWALGLATTIAVNVGINLRTSRGTHDDPVAWRRMRRRWELFQGIRSWLFLVSFVLVCVGAAIG